MVALSAWVRKKPLVVEPGFGVGGHHRWRLVHRRSNLLLGLFPELEPQRTYETDGLLQRDETGRADDETGRAHETRAMMARAAT
jgi:hypothetical protein